MIWLISVCAYLFGWVVCARQYALGRWYSLPGEDAEDLSGKPSASAGYALFWPFSAVFWLLFVLWHMLLWVIMSDMKDSDD